ncbi:MAG: GNAT family N-acetyltransferase [Flavimaricola sp.]|nr:GNAT family N-acetyltransferase [Flavimaricola sp.]
MPDITLRPVTRDDLRPLFRLKVNPEQADFVAPNEITLAQAPYETGAEVFGLWQGETLVGMIATIDMARHAYRMEGDDAESLYIWRLMVGAEHQGKGYGRAALAAMHERANGGGFRRLSLSVVPTNSVAIALYESVGFQNSGRIIDGEMLLLKDLEPADSKQQGGQNSI